MKLFKMFGLAALTVLLAMAFVGANSAVAEPTALCYKDPGEGLHEVCPAGQLVEHVHLATLAGQKAKFLGANTECDVLFLGRVLNENLLSNGGEEILGISGNYTYTNCTNNCTVTETDPPTLLDLLKIMHEFAVDNEEAVVNSLGEVRVVCGVFINCYYDLEGPEGRARGPLLSPETNGEVSIQEKELTVVKGILCPSQTKLDILLTPLVKIYITE